MSLTVRVLCIFMLLWAVAGCTDSKFWYSRLSGDEIEEKLTGRTISSFGLNDSMPPFREEFERNGNWKGQYQHIMLQSREGTWHVDGNQVCVQYNDYPIRCREVWWSSTFDQFLIADLSSFGTEYEDHLRELRYGD